MEHEQSGSVSRQANNPSVSSDVADDLEIVSENDPLLGSLGYRTGRYTEGHEEEDEDTRARLGYEQRKRVNQTGNYMYPDHGTYLGFRVPAEEELPPMDNPITVALHKCEKQVLRPYLRLLRLVGWQPLFDDCDLLWQKVLNFVYPGIVVFLIFLGYVIQYAACFRRDRAGEGFNEPWLPMSPSNTTNSSLVPAGEVWPPCQHYLLSQYMLPDVLHSAAYAFSFWMYRIAQSEQIPVLMEKVFLQTSPTQSGFLSQGKLIRNLRIMLYASKTWVFLSQISQIIHVCAQYKDIDFHWLEPSQGEAGRVVLILIMSLSFVVLDVVYMTVVISYCVQSFLLIFFVEGLAEKVRERKYSLDRAMKETFEVQGHIKFLNHKPGTALSIVMVNFGTMAILGTLALVDPNTDMYTGLMYAATGMAVVLWFSIMLLPLVQAARLSAACNSLRKLGHEIKVRPFGWQDEKEAELDSFLLFQSSLSMKAKIFLIPVRSSYLCGLVVLIGVTFVLLFQSGYLSIFF